MDEQRRSEQDHDKKPLEGRPSIRMAIFVGLAAAGWFIAIMLWIQPSVSLEPTAVWLPAPNWEGTRLQVECRPPDELEQQRNQLASQLLATFRPDDMWSQLRSATINQFVYGNPGRKGEKEKVCPPTQFYADIAKAAVSAGIFDAVFLDRDATALAHRIGPQDTRIVDAIIRTAFYPGVIREGGDTTGRDVRSYARLALVDFCKTIPIPASRALQQMSYETQSGRAAARVAIACGSQEALPIVSGWMQQLLDSAGRRVIDQYKAAALFDLAHALETAEARAQPYSGPIITLFDREIQSWAPPFGMLNISPIWLCAVARRIGGAVIEKANTKDFCQNQKEY